MIRQENSKNNSILKMKHMQQIKVYVEQEKVACINSKTKSSNNRSTE